MKEKKLLDHGLVRLVDHMGSDLSIVRAARVSYDADWRAGENEKGAANLINYLMKNKHTTPFEAPYVTFEVFAPIFVVRQWQRHRTQSYNEVSARYTELPEVFYVPDPKDITGQAEGNKQCREGDPIELARLAARVIREHSKRSFEVYRDLQVIGVPRELSRSVLPVNTYTHMFTSMNLLNLLKFLQLRCHSHAQMEIRVYAEAMLEMVEEIYPVTIAAFKKHVLKEG